MRLVLLILLTPTPIMAAPVSELLIQSFKDALPSGAKVEIVRHGGPAKMPQSASVAWFRPRPPVGAVGYELSWEDKSGAKRWRGTADVRVRLPVVVATSALRNDREISEGDVRLELRDLQPHLGSGYFTSLTEVKGKAIRGWVRKGRVLSEMNVVPPKLVRSGQQVRLVRKMGSLQVTARVRSMQDGRLGDWIRVQNLKSRKMMKVRVASQGVVSFQ